MKLSLGFSPCPNDTFIFDALIHHKIDTEGLEFDVTYEDVESLNTKAFKNELAITKLSYHAYAYATDNYVLLDAGSALGFGVGPLLITKNTELVERLSQISNLKSQPSNLNIGIPGRYTTANFLLGLAFPELTRKQELLFSDIEQALLNNEIDLGLIIHENRFTYAEKGLHKVIDLGDYWEKETGMPIPLGGIVVQRHLPDPIKNKLNRVLRRSVEYALANPESGLEFIRSHAQEMSESVMYQHINLYVNRFSVSLEKEGRMAIQTLFDKATQLGLIPRAKEPLFFD